MAVASSLLDSSGVGVISVGMPSDHDAVGIAGHTGTFNGQRVLAAGSWWWLRPGRTVPEVGRACGVPQLQEIVRPHEGCHTAAARKAACCHTSSHPMERRAA